MIVSAYAVLACMLAPGAALDDVRNWKETAIVPIGASFAVPTELSTSIRSSSNIQITVPQVEQADVTTFIATGSASDTLKQYIVETSDIRVLDSFLAASLGYLTANASFSRTTIVVVEQWRKFIPVTIEVAGLPSKVRRWDEKKKRWEEEPSRRSREKVSAQIGFSMSIVTRVDATDARANTGSLLRAFSAGVNFHRYSAMSSTEVIGLSDLNITANLPSASDFLNAQTRAGDGDDQTAGYRRHRALVEAMATKFGTLRNTAWMAANSRPMVIGLDLDAMERLTGQVYDGYSQGRR